MTANTPDFFVQAWKHQLDAGLRLIEAVIEGAEKLRETQLQAAANAHADAEATRKAIAAATDPAEIFRIQTEWCNANVRKCMAYWRSMCEVVAETDAELARCAGGGAAPAPGPGDSSQALYKLIDGAYRQWLDSTQQFYKLPAIPAQAPAEKRAAA